ncbi:hypothetical protein [Thermodesulfatator indicus]|uniref:hypothetical protein n=1 Tax=Thermodesulfatator indicus TaxID=171695 RepID=UPI0002EDC70E|nr:hypothetical protein [Thermodesulfatator indicus]
MSKGKSHISYIIDLMWPELEGDAAIHALETTIYRLRKIIKDKKFIEYQGQIINIKTSNCYIDLWDIQELLDKLSDALLKKENSKIFILTKNILNLYDDFLPGYENYLAISLRRNLKKRVSSLITKSLHFLKNSFPDEFFYLQDIANNKNLISKLTTDKVHQRLSRDLCKIC